MKKSGQGHNDSALLLSFHATTEQNNDGGAGMCWSVSMQCRRWLLSLAKRKFTEKIKKRRQKARKTKTKVVVVW